MEVGCGHNNDTTSPAAMASFHSVVERVAGRSVFPPAEEALSLELASP